MAAAVHPRRRAHRCGQPSAWLEVEGPVLGRLCVQPLMAHCQLAMEGCGMRGSGRSLWLVPVVPASHHALGSILPLAAHPHLDPGQSTAGCD